MDANGVAVTDLSRDDFRVYDNDVQRPIQNLWIDQDKPITLGVIIDASESQQDQFQEHVDTARALLERLLHPGDRFFVVSVAESVRLKVDLTGSIDGLNALVARSGGALLGEPCPAKASKLPGVGSLSTCGSSPLWNAIYSVALIKLNPLKGNKALLILTDGFDSGSNRTWRQAADAVNAANASFYGIQYKGESGRGYATDFYRLLLETGGTRFQAPNGDYRPIVSRIEADLRDRYVVGFRPEQLSAKTRHEVRIEVTRPGLTVRARKTYFRDP